MEYSGKPESTSELIPELGQWNDGKGIEVSEWISAVGNYSHAIGYLCVFWPEFCEVDGYVFCRPVDKHELSEWEVFTGRNRQEIEKVVNHMHISDLFPNSDPPSMQQVLFLTETLKTILTVKLKNDFPQRRISVVSSGNQNDLQTIFLTFYQQ